MSTSVQQIVLRLQRDAEKEQSIFWYRRAIVELVDNFLLDLENASRNLESLGNSSECFSSVQLCEFFVGSSADIFMQVSVQGADTPPLTQIKSIEPTAEENISIAFCTWLTHRLLRLLSSEGCGSLHPVCFKVLTHVLQTARVRSAHIFRRFMAQLVRCLAEMVEVCEDAEGPGPKVRIQAFEVDLDLVKQGLSDPSRTQSELQQCDTIQEAVLEFDDPLQCEVLQVNIMKLLLGFVADLPHYDTVSSHSLLATTLIQVELGDLPLKMVSLEAVTHLVKVCGIPCDEGLQAHLVALIDALILMLSTSDNLPQPEASKLEEKTAALIDCLLSTERQNQYRHATLGKSHLQQVFTCVTSHLSSEGIGRLSTAVMRESVMGLLCYGLDRLPVVVLGSLGKSLLEQLGSVCLSLLGGPYTDLQFAAPLLARLITLEGSGGWWREGGSSVTPLTPHTPRPGPLTHTQDPQAQRTSSRLSCKRQEATCTQGESKRRKTTRLFQRLMDRMAEMIGLERNTVNCVPVLVAARLVCEVSGRCALISSGADDGTGTFGLMVCYLWQYLWFDGLLSVAVPVVVCYQWQYLWFDGLLSVAGATSHDPCAQGATSHDPCAQGATSHDPCAQRATSHDPCAQGAISHDPCAQRAMTHVLREPPHMTHVLREPSHMTHVLREPSHMTHVLREPPHMTHVLKEPSHMTHVLREPSHMTHVLREPSHMTHVLREPLHMTHVLREPSHMIHVLREPSDMTHVLREPPHMTHVLREPSHMTHVLMEPPHMTHVLREPPHMTHVLREPSHMTHVLREPPHMTHVLKEPSHMTHVLREPPHMTHVLREPPHMTHVLREP
ncbi:hypothetical protein ACOMHN_026924 [Nucella lapillus]